MAEAKEQESRSRMNRQQSARINTHREQMLASHTNTMSRLPLHNRLVSLVIAQIQEQEPLSQDLFTLAWRAEPTRVFNTLTETCKIGMRNPKTHPFWTWYNNYIKHSSPLVEPNPLDPTERVHQSLSRLAASMSRTAMTVKNLFNATSTEPQRHLYNLPHSQMIEIEKILSKKFHNITEFHQFKAVCESWSPDLEREFVQSISNMILAQRDPYMLLRIALGTVPFDVVSSAIIAIILSFLDAGNIAELARVNRSFKTGATTNETIVDTHVEIPVRDRAIHVFHVSWSKNKKVKVVRFDTTSHRSMGGRIRRVYDSNLQQSLSHLVGTKLCVIDIHLQKSRRTNDPFLRDEILPAIKSDVMFQLHFARADPHNSDKSRRNDPLLVSPPSPYTVLPPRLQYFLDGCVNADRIILSYVLYRIRLCRDDPYSDLDDTYNKVQNCALPGMAFTVAFPPQITHVTWDFGCSSGFTSCLDALSHVMEGVRVEEISRRVANITSLEVRSLVAANNVALNNQLVRWFSQIPNLERLHFDSLQYLRMDQLMAAMQAHPSIRVLEVECDRRTEWGEGTVQQLVTNFPNVEEFVVTFGRGDFLGNPMQLIAKFMENFPVFENMTKLTINICRLDISRESKRLFEWDINNFAGMLTLPETVSICVRFLHIPFLRIHRGIYVENPKHEFYAPNMASFVEFLLNFFQRFDFEVDDDPKNDGRRYHWARLESFNG